MSAPKAFPGASVLQSGMDLRDWFAGQALKAIIAATSAGQHRPTKAEDNADPIVSGMCRDAYTIADAMMAERKRQGGVA